MAAPQKRPAGAKPGGAVTQKGPPPTMSPQDMNIIPEDKTSGLVRTAVKAHNEKRALHGCPPLGYSEALSKPAKEWADSLLRRGAFEHSPGNAYGENIYMRGGSQPVTDETAVQSAVDQWYAEIRDFKLFNMEPTMQELMAGKPTGHFTQLIWKGSKAMGMGLAKGDQNRVIVVVNYAPPGNIVGAFKENVPSLVAGNQPKAKT